MYWLVQDFSNRWLIPAGIQTTLGLVPKNNRGICAVSDTPIIYYIMVISKITMM